MNCRAYFTVLAVLSWSTVVHAYITVHGGATYDSTTNTGIHQPSDSSTGDGTAVEYGRKIVSGNDLGDRAVRWDASGASAMELGNLGTDNNGYTINQAYAVNAAGTAIGYGYKYDSGTYMGAYAPSAGMQ